MTRGLLNAVFEQREQIAAGTPGAKRPQERYVVKRLTVFNEVACRGALLRFPSARLFPTHPAQHAIA